MIRYDLAPDVGARIQQITKLLEFTHIDPERVICMRSHGSTSQTTLARCHALPKIMQLALGQRPAYVVEILAETFDRLPEGEQTKTLIHELMHIPRNFGGGFRNHRPHVTRRRVDRMYEAYRRAAERAAPAREKPALVNAVGGKAGARQVWSRTEEG